MIDFEAEKEKNLELLSDIAKSFGGELLTFSYKNLHDRFTFRCKNGHIFIRRGGHVKYNKLWCQQCNSRKLTIEKIREKAKENGFELISEEINAEHIYMYRCKNNHILETTHAFIIMWQKTPTSIGGG